jgi:hypothetical protein
MADSQKERDKMNKLQEKATELIEIAKVFGLEAHARPRGDEFVDIEYITKKSRIYTCLSYTETGKVRIDTWETNAGKRETVPAKYLGELFSYVAATEKRHAQKASA